MPEYIDRQKLIKALSYEGTCRSKNSESPDLLRGLVIAILAAKKEVETADVIPVVRCAEEAERVTMWQAAAEFGRSASDTWENANSATKTLADALYKPEEEE